MSLLDDSVKWLLKNAFRGDKVPEEIGKARLEICGGCKKFNQKKRTCLVCGCYMDVKAWLVVDPMASFEEGREILSICADNPPKWDKYIFTKNS